MNNIIKLVIEKDGDTFWGWTLNEEGISPNTCGTSIEEVKNSVVDLIKWDLTEPDTNAGYWKNFDFNNIEWEISFNLEALFDEFNFLKISDIAKAADINPSLMRQYAVGLHNPSKKQAQKIEDSIHQLAKRMLTVRVV